MDERNGHGRAHGGGAAARSMAGMNVVLFVTDQDRAVQHFPPGGPNETSRGSPACSATG